MKQFKKSALAALGVELGRNPGWKISNLQKEGFAPKSIFDVGAAYGTPALYQAFPCAHHVLVEPLVEYKPHLENVLQKYEGSYVQCGAGSKDETLTINVDPKQLMKSSLHDRTPLSTSNDDLQTREIQICTLDNLRKDLSLKAPFGIKINVGGFECQVIEGASSLLDETQFVIAEISVAKRFHECTSFADFIRIMDDAHFHLCDILDAPRRGPEIILVNAVFRRLRS